MSSSRNTTQPDKMVLVVDDEPMVCETARQLLADNGYQVLGAPSADKAEELYRQHLGSINLLVADFTLPDSDGVTLYHRLNSLYPQLRALLITGYDREHLGSRLPSGMEFLQKPFSLNTFSGALNRLVGGSG